MESFSHLGHLITNDVDDGGDISLIRNKPIIQTNKVLCYFG